MLTTQFVSDFLKVHSPLVEQLVAVDLLEVAEELLGGASLGGRLEEVVAAQPYGQGEVWQHSGGEQVVI